MSDTAITTRMAWPDVARGVSILGVMTLHATFEVPGGSDTVIAKANELIAMLRMPLFFLVAGFFARKVYRFNVVELFSKRIWFLLVPYLCWAPVEIFFARLKLLRNLDVAMPTAEFYRETVVWGLNMYWFLWVLIIFTVVLWLTKAWPTWAQFALPVVVIAATPWLLAHGNLSTPRLVAYLPLFLLGAYLRPAITWFADNALRWQVAVSAIIVGGIAAVVHQFVIRGELVSETFKPVVDVMISIGLIPLGVLAAVILAKVPVLGAALMKVGRHTLVAYLGHPIALSIIFSLGIYGRVNIEPGADVVFETPTFWVLMCLVMCGLGAVVMYSIARTPIVGWTIHPPKIAGFLEKKRAPLASSMP
ncbi:putative membrane protein [Corynebacterium mustelae]|uniref:Putative membrane protein n=1 Tax=Corynebacterium mustelae TaxID=571915 RepID=A0A0G3H5S5_9CORY|nr:acyltransferase family protein [Corynebacterium mustelae]AKK06507.1 putative membrane protein [Corynebacterium mustelae]